MDCKITKKRLSNALVYGWLLVAFIIALSLILWEVIFTSTAVSLKTGQKFSVFYDQSVGSTNANYLNKLLTDNDTFSYEVQDLTYEGFSAQYNTMVSRVSAQQGSILVTDTTPSQQGDYKTYNLYKVRVDSCPLFTMDELLDKATNYLKEFLPNGSTKTPPYDYSDLDENKINKCFYDRNSKDNRFLTSSAKDNGVKLERKRIQKLCENVKEFDRLLKLDAQNVQNGQESIFYTYTRYEQQYNIETDPTEKQKYKNLYDAEKSAGRENARFALKASALNGGEGKLLAQNYFYKNNTTVADDVIISCFDYTNYDHHLQYESIGFYLQIIKMFSTILD